MAVLLFYPRLGGIGKSRPAIAWMHSSPWTPKTTLALAEPREQKGWAMRRFRFIVGQTLSLTAALFVALAPLFHALHLADVGHNHACRGVHSAGHAHCAHCCSHVDNQHDSHVSENSGTGNEGGKEHDPDTCPLCQAFTSITNNFWLPIPRSPVVSPQPYLSIPFPDQLVLQDFYFSSVYARAPPAC